MIPHELDALTLVQTIAAEADLPRFLRHSLETIAVYSQAQRLVLLEAHEAQWQPLAQIERTAEGVTFSQTFEHPSFDQALSQRVATHPKLLLTASPLEPYRFFLPLFFQKQTIGLLYGVFVSPLSAGQLQLLLRLAPHMAISFHKAKQQYRLQEEVVWQREQLVKADALITVGNMVASVAHEINTSVGIGITVASTFQHETNDFVKTFHDKGVKRSELKSYLITASQSQQMLLTHLQRAADLLQSFKQVVVDQIRDDQRTVAVIPCLEKLLFSLQPRLKHTPHRCTIIGDEKLEVFTSPGALAQITTNLIINSLTHAFSEHEAGEMEIQVAGGEGEWSLTYRDNGCGIPESHYDYIFEPFFTTAPSGSGLGLYIVHNLVTQQLQGSIECVNGSDYGTTFVIKLPQDA